MLYGQKVTDLYPYFYKFDNKRLIDEENEENESKDTKNKKKKKY
jgi:hypothetical protein